MGPHRAEARPRPRDRSRTRTPHGGEPDLPAASDLSDVAAALLHLASADDGPQLSSQLARNATANQFREFVIHRSLYHLKEADPHSWAIPRLSGPAKAALVEIQSDEYGGGRPDRMHAHLFATMMHGLGLDGPTAPTSTAFRR